MKKILFSLLFLLISIPAFSKTLLLNVYVDRVIDGDTIVVSTCTGLELRVRFAMIDTYESSPNKHLLKQEKITKLSKEQILKLGKQAKEFVFEKINHKMICLKLDTKHFTGAYGRYLGFIYNKPCQNLQPDDISLNMQLIENHLAIYYKEK